MLSDAAKEARRQASIKAWLKKAKDYGVYDASLSDEENVKAARRVYDHEYWERKASLREGE